MWLFLLCVALLLSVVDVNAGRVLTSGSKVVSNFKPSLANKLFKRSQEVGSMRDLKMLLDGDKHFRRPSSGGGTVLLRFTAQWCKPCRSVAPRFAELADSGKFGRTQFVTVDIDKALDVASHYKVQSVPTFVLLDADSREVLTRVTGADMQQLEAALSKHN
jgi:thiol-disulfide isomerase/thioredoxin